MKSMWRILLKLETGIGIGVLFILIKADVPKIKILSELFGEDSVREKTELTENEKNFLTDHKFEVAKFYQDNKVNK
jgi:hypothetical protein